MTSLQEESFHLLVLEEREFLEFAFLLHGQERIV